MWWRRLLLRLLCLLLTWQGHGWLDILGLCLWLMRWRGELDLLCTWVHGHAGHCWL